MVSVVLNISILLLPISLYLISICYQNNVKVINKNILSFILVALVLVFILLKDYTRSFVLINIPLLISYLKRKNITSIILSVLIIIYYIFIHKFNCYFIIIEYLLYYIIYLIISKSYKTVSLIYIFTFIKSITLCVEMFYFRANTYSFAFTYLLVVAKLFGFYVSSYLVFIYLLKGEDIMNINTAMKELEKEKVLRTSLFKLTHEIKNPLAVCKGYLDMLDLNNQEKVDKYIPIVKGEIERTLTLMDDYLDYTKVKINKEEVDIYLLLDEIIKSLEMFFKENKIVLNIDVPDDELYLSVDFNRIKQVIINILKNSKEARDINKDNLTIKIKTRITKLYFKIIIEDNGIGMDQDTLRQVMDLFFTTKRNGTGLGTSLSKEIVELHGGNIKYLSELNKGTTVIVSLPL